MQCMHQRGWFDRRCVAEGGEAALPEWRIQGVSFPGGERSRVEAANGSMQQRDKKPAVCVRPCGEASGGPWLHQAAAAGAAVEPACVFFFPQTFLKPSTRSQCNRSYSLRRVSGSM